MLQRKRNNNKWKRVVETCLDVLILLYLRATRAFTIKLIGMEQTTLVSDLVSESFELLFCLSGKVHYCRGVSFLGFG